MKSLILLLLTSSLYVTASGEILNWTCTPYESQLLCQTRNSQLITNYLNWSDCTISTSTAFCSKTYDNHILHNTENMLMTTKSEFGYHTYPCAPFRVTPYSHGDSGKGETGVMNKYDVLSVFMYEGEHLLFDRCLAWGYFLGFRRGLSCPVAQGNLWTMSSGIYWARCWQWGWIAWIMGNNNKYTCDVIQLSHYEID